MRGNVSTVDYDQLTGLLNHNAFCRGIEEIIDDHEEEIAQGKYALIYFDILRFKAVNDMFGMQEGDALLVHVANVIRKYIKEGDLACRHGADRYMIFIQNEGVYLERFIQHVLDDITNYDLLFDITCNMGVYVTRDGQMSSNSMIDRAVLAQSAIKGSYTTRHNYYTEELRKDMLGEQEIVGMTNLAMAQRQFVAYYQPQYEHSTGSMIGAEALVRWKHPERGLISPGTFIPIFEKNGFITKLDMYVFEEVCVFLRKCLDEGVSIVPISTNFSRHDIFQHDFVESLEYIRKRYDIPVKYLRLEITESVAEGGIQHVVEIVQKLHDFGYMVEMDDFGSGYSSLNVLKDLDVDVIKLDMSFISQDSKNRRGAIILSSIIRMAKWLKLPVIMEGVETPDQIQYLKSIGCDYIQGYLYSRPLPEEDFVQLLLRDDKGQMIPKLSLIDDMDPFDFWDPKSMENLVFHHCVGGAAMFSYKKGRIELLRINEKYIQEICMNISERELLESDPLEVLDEENKQIYLDTVLKALRSRQEQVCDTWRDYTSNCCGDDKICIRSNIHLIGECDRTFLFYAMIRNVTTEKEYTSGLNIVEKKLEMLSEQADIYYWEYMIATKEMRPCFRCMRDLGLPPVVENYPEPAIEKGIFPPEVADMYRDWHRQVAEGVPYLEAIMPMTVGRVPFRVRYTTEFDEAGRPVKAYGSAIRVVED